MVLARTRVHVNVDARLGQMGADRILDTRGQLMGLHGARGGFGGAGKPPPQPGAPPRRHPKKAPGPVRPKTKRMGRGIRSPAIGSAIPSPVPARPMPKNAPAD